MEFKTSIQMERIDTDDSSMLFSDKLDNNSCC